MSRAAVVAVALAVLSGCTETAVVLDDPEQLVTSCDEAWQLAAPGWPCAFDGSCIQDSPGDPACCSDYAYCRMGALVIDTVCAPDCACADDTSCDYGLEVCTDQRCQACPSTEACGPCPDGWRRLTRNGCETCACAPPSDCGLPYEPCNEPATDYCYPGASCGEGCDPFSDPTCCANACATAGCAEPVPLGCVTACTDPGMPCGLCATTRCACVEGQWQCESSCVDELTATCVY